MNKHQRFVVIAERGSDRRCFGVYRSFKAAEGDAKAADGQQGYVTYVLPVESPEDLP